MTLHLAEFRRAVRAFRDEHLPGMRAYYRAAAASAADHARAAAIRAGLTGYRKPSFWVN